MTNARNEGLTLENAGNVSNSLLPYGGITYFINSFDYPNLLFFNSTPGQHQYLYKLFPQ